MHKVFAFNAPCDEIREQLDLQTSFGLGALARANSDPLGVDSPSPQSTTIAPVSIAFPLEDEKQSALI